MNSRDRSHFRSAIRRALVVMLLAGGLPQGAAAFDDLGQFLPPCSSFTTCTAALRSAANAAVVHQVSEISPGYNLPSGLSAGTTVRSDPVSTPASATIRAGDDPTIPGIPTPFGGFAVARAQTDFGTHRGSAWTTLGARGIDRQGSDSARIEVGTSAVAESAWRDVFSFTGDGHFHADVAIDGHSATFGNAFPSSFEVLGHTAVASWSYELNVWDVSRLVPDADGILAPTHVARVSDGGLEQRSSFASLLGLDFDFLAASSYVVTSRFSTFANNNREVDLFNTVALRNLALSDGAGLSALSGHDYGAQAVAPVPEPSTWLLFAGGLAAMARLARRRGRAA